MIKNVVRTTFTTLNRMEKQYSVHVTFSEFKVHPQLLSSRFKGSTYIGNVEKCYLQCRHLIARIFAGISLKKNPLHFCFGRHQFRKMISSSR